MYRGSLVWVAISGVWRLCEEYARGLCLFKARLMISRHACGVGYGGIVSRGS